MEEHFFIRYTGNEKCTPECWKEFQFLDLTDIVPHNTVSFFLLIPYLGSRQNVQQFKIFKLNIIGYCHATLLKTQNKLQHMDFYVGYIMYLNA